MKNLNVPAAILLSLFAAVLVCSWSSRVAAEDSSNAANSAAGQPPATPNPATGQNNKSAQQNEADNDDLLVLRGKFYANKDASGAGGGDEVGTLVTDKESYKILTIDEEYIKKLKAQDNKTISLKGKVNETEKSMRLHQIIEDTPPSAEYSNPRGL